MSKAPETTNSNSNNTTKIVIAAAAVIIVLAVCVTVIILFRGGNGEAENTPASGLTIGYEQGASVIMDEDALQAAVEEALENARKGLVALSYENSAYSTDGKTFSCYIANDVTNLYDMFLTICADSALEDQLLVTGLFPPGSGFEEITLDRRLEKGNHTVYVVVSTVETMDDGEQVMRGQVVHTMDFHVQ